MRGLALGPACAEPHGLRGPGRVEWPVIRALLRVLTLRDEQAADSVVPAVRYSRMTRASSWRSADARPGIGRSKARGPIRRPPCKCHPIMVGRNGRRDKRIRGTEAFPKRRRPTNRGRSSAAP